MAIAVLLAVGAILSARDPDPAALPTSAEASRPDPVLLAQRHGCRLLDPAEQKKALRIVARLLQAANAPFALDGKSQAEQEVHIAQKLKDRALLAAAERTIAEGTCCLGKGVVDELKSDESWYHWNLDFPMRDGERRWMEVLHVPIDLTRFPEVQDRKVRLSRVRGEARAAADLAWNARPFEERRKLVAQASAAREEWSRIEQQLSATADAGARSKLGLRQRELQSMLMSVPRKCDPVTLDATR